MAGPSESDQQRKTVIWSVEAPGGQVCVDLFWRGDGTYGFEEYRRDPEDGRGWYPVGGHADDIYPDRTSAERAALRAVDWLGAAMPTSGPASR